MSKVSDRMIGIKVLVQGILISMISVYAPDCAVDYNQKNNFCMIASSVLLESQGWRIIILVISVYAPQFSAYDSLIRW